MGLFSTEVALAGDMQFAGVDLGYHFVVQTICLAPAAVSPEGAHRRVRVPIDADTLAELD